MKNATFIKNVECQETLKENTPADPSTRPPFVNPLTSVPFRRVQIKKNKKTNLLEDLSNPREWRIMPTKKKSEERDH